MKKDGVISEDGRYRYSLIREWDDSLPTMAWVMLNPSTADADIDDPTIRRCIGIAKREGCGSILVANLYAFRATNPKTLRSVMISARGPENEKHLLLALTCGRIVVGWGSPNGLFVPSRNFFDSAQRHGRTLECLGTTKDGYPRHPLYVKGDQPLVEWRPK